MKYVDNFDFNDKNSFWKVITPRANGSDYNGFGIMIIGKPNEIHTDSYISFRVCSEQEALSLKSYLETPIVNNILSIRKISQDINQDTIKWIPMVPFDRKWTDERVIEYLKLNI